MPSSLRDANISDTYVGVLHAGGAQLPANDRSTIYDGYGNISALSVGCSGNGISITGQSVFESIAATQTIVDSVVANDFVSAPNTTKAWALVQGNGTVTSQYNIASVVRSSPGDYTATFTSPLPTANYSVNITTTYDNTSNRVIFAYVKAVPAPTTNTFSFRTDFLNTGTTAARFDPATISITVNHL